MIMLSFGALMMIFLAGIMVGGMIGMVLMACMSADRGDDDEETE